MARPRSAPSSGGGDDRRRGTRGGAYGIGIGLVLDFIGTRWRRHQTRSKTVESLHRDTKVILGRDNAQRELRHIRKKLGKDHKKNAMRIVTRIAHYNTKIHELSAASLDLTGRVTAGSFVRSQFASCSEAALCDHTLAYEAKQVDKILTNPAYLQLILLQQANKLRRYSRGPLLTMGGPVPQKPGSLTKFQPQAPPVPPRRGRPAAAPAP